MSKKSSTTLTLSVRLRLPPGAKRQDAIDFLKDAMQGNKAALMQAAPMKPLELNEVIIKVLNSSTTYY